MVDRFTVQYVVKVFRSATIWLGLQARMFVLSTLKEDIFKPRTGTIRSFSIIPSGACDLYWKFLERDTFLLEDDDALLFVMFCLIYSIIFHFLFAIGNQTSLKTKLCLPTKELHMPEAHAYHRVAIRTGGSSSGRVVPPRPRVLHVSGVIRLCSLSNTSVPKYKPS